MSAPDEEVNPLTRKLWHIAGTGDLDELEKLLNQGADVNAGDRTGVTALMRAAYHGQLTMVRALIEHGAQPNAKDRSGLTALSMAGHAGHQEIVETLLSSGAQSKKKASKPRPVGSLTNESISPATNHEATPPKSSEVTPPKSSEVTPTKSSEVRPTKPSEVTPAKPSEVRTLQEPPDIWNLVQTTQPKSDLPPIAYSPSKELGKFVSPRTLALAAGAVIICFAAVFGLVALRRGASDTDKASDQRTEPSAVGRSSPANQLSSTVNRRTRQSNQSAKIAPVGRLGGQPANKLTAPAAAAAILPAKKPVARHRSGTGESLTRHAKRTTTRLESDDTSSKSAKKEQSLPANDAVRPSVTQKPKVIQWP